jgi:hypothetical protein
VMELFRQCGVMELFRQCGVMALFRQCGVFHCIIRLCSTMYIFL